MLVNREACPAALPGSFSRLAGLGTKAAPELCRGPPEPLGLEEAPNRSGTRIGPHRRIQLRLGVGSTPEHSWIESGSTPDSAPTAPDRPLIDPGSTHPPPNRRFQERERACICGCGAPEGADVEHYIRRLGISQVALRHVGIDPAPAMTVLGRLLAALGEMLNRRPAPIHTFALPLGFAGARSVASQRTSPPQIDPGAGSRG